MARTSRRQAEKALKKVHKGYIIVAICSLLVGAALGVFFARFQIKGDKLELNGERNVTVTSAEGFRYEDEGVTCISKGKDLSDKVEIKTNMIPSEDGRYYTVGSGAEGEYYITYTVTEGRYAGLSRVRIFTVAPEVDNEG